MRASEWFLFDSEDTEPVQAPETGLILVCRMKKVGANPHAIQYADVLPAKDVSPKGRNINGQKYTHWMPLVKPAFANMKQFLAYVNPDGF